VEVKYSTLTSSPINYPLKLLVCQAQANGNSMDDVTVIQRLAVNTNEFIMI